MMVLHGIQHVLLTGDLSAESNIEIFSWKEKHLKRDKILDMKSVRHEVYRSQSSDQ